MMNQIVISGTCGSGKTDTLLTLAANLSHIQRYDKHIIWNGEDIICSIVSRLESKNANMDRIVVMSRNEKLDDSIVSGIDGLKFNLYIDDPFGVIFLHPDRDEFEVEEGSLLKLLVDKAGCVHITRNVRRQATQKEFNFFVAFLEKPE